MRRSGPKLAEGHVPLVDHVALHIDEHGGRVAAIHAQSEAVVGLIRFIDIPDCKRRRLFLRKRHSPSLLIPTQTAGESAAKKGRRRQIKENYRSAEQEADREQSNLRQATHHSSSRSCVRPDCRLATLRRSVVSQKARSYLSQRFLSFILHHVKPIAEVSEPDVQHFLQS